MFENPIAYIMASGEKLDFLKDQEYERDADSPRVLKHIHGSLNLNK